MKNPLVKISLGLMFILGGANSASAAVAVTANVYQSSAQDTITLTNSSTAGEAISDFYFACSPSPVQNYMATAPTNIQAPTGWTGTVVSGSDGFGIHFSTTSSYLAASASLSGFAFTATSSLDGNSATYSSTPIATSTAVASASAGTQTFTATLSSVTAPEGVMTYTFVSGTTTYLSFPLNSDPIYSDAVAASPAPTQNTISVTNATAFDLPNTTTVEALEQPSSAVPYFVKFLTGAQAGRVLLITANTATSLTLDLTDHTPAPYTQTTPLVSSPSNAFDVMAGDTFEVFQGQTLASLFGSGTTADPLVSLSGGTSVITADTVGIPSFLGGAVAEYFFNTKSGVNCWTKYQATANANNTIIYPYSPIEITRNAAGTATYTFQGAATEVPVLLKTLGSTTTFSASPYATGVALNALNLGPNWTKGTKVINSDTLNVWNPGNGVIGHFDVYFQLSSAGNPWRKYGAGNTDFSTFVIPAGSLIQIAKQSSVSGSTSFLLPALPY
jgi:hypothetical protein